jgi:hypothetical protein
MLLREIANLCSTEAKIQSIYLWVLEPNENVRQFYERLGAENKENDIWVLPDGSSIPRLRYTWANIDKLTDAKSSCISLASI